MGDGEAIVAFILLILMGAVLYFAGMGAIAPSPHTVCRAEYGDQSYWSYDFKRCVSSVEPKLSKEGK